MRMIRTAAILVALVSPISAQPAPAGPPTYTLTVTPDELNTIGRGLDELPAKIANPLSQRLVQQINAQNEAFKKANEPKAEPEKPADQAVPLPPKKP